MPVRFHLDENVSGAVAHALRLRGLDVTVPREMNLIGARDKEHLSHCIREGRVLVTHDEDFLKLHADGITHPGIDYCGSGKRSIGEIIHMLILLWKAFDSNDMSDRVEYL